MRENGINDLTPQNEKTFYFRHKEQVLAFGNNNLKQSVGKDISANRMEVYFLRYSTCISIYFFNWKYNLTIATTTKQTYLL